MNNLKRVKQNNTIYDYHILLSNGNELKGKILSHKDKEEIRELISDNLPWKVFIDKIYQISAQPGVDFIEDGVIAQ